MHIQAMQAPNSFTSAVSEVYFENTTMDLQIELYHGEDGKALVDLNENVGSEGNYTNSKCQKLIIKMKSGRESGPAPTAVHKNSNLKSQKLHVKLRAGRESGLDDDDGYSDARKRKREKGETKINMGKKSNLMKGEIKSRVKKSRRREMRDHDADSEIEEMWDTIVGCNSKDDEDGIGTVDEDDFIDDNERSPIRHLKAKKGKVDCEIEELFKIGRKKKKERDPAATALLVESVVAQLEVAAEEDAELNRQQKPAIIKLRNLSLLTDVIPRKNLQQEFIDHGVLPAIRGWLEPLPDGSLANITVRAAIYQCLNDLSIDLERKERREQLMNSGLGKAIIFYYKWNEDYIPNRKLAKQLLEKWSRIILGKSTNYEDMKNYEVKRTYKRPPVKKAMSNAPAGVSLDDNLDLPELSQGLKSELSSSRRRACKPEAISMDFVVRPPSKVDPEAVRAEAKRNLQGQQRAKLNKKLERMKAPTRKQLQALKPSAVGRGMIKYI